MLLGRVLVLDVELAAHRRGAVRGAHPRHVLRHRALGRARHEHDDVLGGGDRLPRAAAAAALRGHRLLREAHLLHQRRHRLDRALARLRVAAVSHLLDLLRLLQRVHHHREAVLAVRGHRRGQ